MRLGNSDTFADDWAAFPLHQRRPEVVLDIAGVHVGSEESRELLGNEELRLGVR